MNPYTVILRYPDWADQDDNGWGGTWQGHVAADNADDAIDFARGQVIAETHSIDVDTDLPDPNDYAVVAVFAGHLESLAPEP